MNEMLVDLIRRQQQLQTELDKVSAAISRARLLDVETEYGVKVGSIVRNHFGKEYRVTKIDADSWGGKPWLRGNPRLKNGTFGKANRHLFSNWEVVNPPEEVDHGNA